MVSIFLCGTIALQIEAPPLCLDTYICYKEALHVSQTEKAKVGSTVSPTPTKAFPTALYA